MFATKLELIELILRIFSDIEPPTPADAVYIFGQTSDNEKSVFIAAVNLFSRGKVKAIAFGHGGCLVSGEAYQPDWLKKLCELGVPEKSIIPIQINSKLAHTHSEALALISCAHQELWKTLYIISPAFHQIRAFVNTISIVLHNYPELKVFSKIGEPLPWIMEATHSQNITRGKRSELIFGEWRRILKYCAKGDLATAKQILAYLNERDK